MFASERAYRDDIRSIESEDPHCHCMNCLNKRVW
jgi:hypothetical protein